MQSFRVLTFLALSCAGFASRSGSPVEKVVKLLQGMEANLKSDSGDETALYEKFSCWCTGMTSKKGAAIDQAKKDLKALGTDILTLRGKISKFASDINDAAADMKTNHEDQQKATNARDLENAAFTALRGEMTQALQSLGQALKMLKMSPQFLQTKTGLSTEQASALRTAIDAIPAHALGSMPAAKLSQLQHISASVAKGEYNPSYGSLVTILEGMNDQFTTDLKAETKTEETSKKNFADLMTTKNKELNALQETVDKREDEKAKAGADLATATQDYDDTEAQMTADITFFNDAVDQCEKKASAWTTRKEMRAEELKGVQEAIKILTSDEARALFSSAIDAGSRVARAKDAGDRLAATTALVQLEVDTVTMLPAQQAAFKVLKTLATKSQSMALAKVAAQVRLASGGHFTEVIKAVDTVIGVLKSEQEDDNKKKTQCNEEYKKVESTSADLDWKIEKNEAKIETLEATIANKKDELAETVQSIKDVKQEIKDMVAQRKAEKEAFDAAKKEDQDAIKLLNQAKTALEAYAKKNDIKGATAFFQGPDDVLRGDSAPKAKFSDKGSRSGQTKGISMLLQSIVEGLQDEIRVQTKVEEQGIKDMAKAKKAAEDLQKALETKKTNLDKAIADRNSDKDEENTKKTSNEKDLKAEQDYHAKIKPDCDFTINNWQDRFNKRKAEMDGLVTAKDYLSGAMSLSQAKKH